MAVLLRARAKYRAASGSLEVQMCVSHRVHGHAKILMEKYRALSGSPAAQEYFLLGPCTFMTVAVLLLAEAGALSRSLKAQMGVFLAGSLTFCSFLIYMSIKFPWVAIRKYHKLG